MENTTAPSSDNRFLCFFTETFLYNIIACQHACSRQEELFFSTGEEEKENFISQ